MTHTIFSKTEFHNQLNSFLENIGSGFKFTGTNVFYEMSNPRNSASMQLVKQFAEFLEFTEGLIDLKDFYDELPFETPESMIVCLFDRHELPENLGPICSDFSFNTFKSVRNELWKRCIEFLSHGTVKLIVTGLTPALCEFLAEACAQEAQGHAMYQSSFDTGYECEEPTGSLILLHYDSVKKDYWEQVIF